MRKNILWIRFVIIFTIPFLFIAGGNAQTVVNYVKEKTYNTASTFTLSINYVDGLGRTIQQKTIGASTGGKDIVTPIEYDATGRVSKSYLPYSASLINGYINNAVSAHNTYYTQKFGTNHYAFTESEYNNSPQDEVIKQSTPGESWKITGDHTVRYDSRKNTLDDGVKKFILIGSSIKYERIYPKDYLVVKQTTDPENNMNIEYYDVRNNLVAKEIRSTSSSNFTYYVYDDLGLQRYIISAKSEKEFNTTGTTRTLSELQKYCFYTEYDEYQRPYKQYIPGAGYTISLYDKRGRLTLSQSEKMRTENKWAFSKYDIYDRVILSGICTGSESSHKLALNSQAIFGEERGTALHGYTNQTYPTSISETLSVSYYDDYTWAGQNSVAFSTADAIGTVKNDRIKGQLTGTKQKVLGITTEQYLTTAVYYDSFYNTIQTVSQLYPIGTEVTSNVYNYSGDVIRAKVKQTIGSAVNEYNKYIEYDNFRRILNVKQQITGDATNGLVTIASYEYDDLGRVYKKNIHNGIDITTYSYNVGGQLIGATSSLFSYELGFDKAETGMSGVVPKYDGNISYMKWKNSDNMYKAYGYSYDSNKQLSSANYLSKIGSTWSASNGYAEKNITYDANGNILSLNRTNSSGGDLHNISYSYSLANNGNAVSGITLNNTTVSGYQYDVAGNLTYDPQRGATIEYNILNLPQRIFGSSGEVSYIYTSSGEKLATKVGSSLTYYRGPFVYSGDAVEYISQPEGLIRKATGNYIYYYTKADHTGSTRLLCHASGNQMVVDQTTEYYPYGLSYRNENLNLNRHLYSGKELQDQTINGKMLGLYDFGSRNYDPILGRWFNIDSALQFTNPYLYCGNSPMMYQDPDGEFIGLLVGFLAGAWLGGTLANDGEMNPFKWDYQSGKTWGYMFGGGAIGAVSAGLGGAIASSGGFMANTGGIMVGSFFNSAGMSMMTDGMIDPMISFGLGSLNLATGEFGYPGKKGNGAMGNIGYAMGAIANISDVLAGFKPGEVQLNTESSDMIGHSALTKVGEISNESSYVSVGPNPGGNWIFNPFAFGKGTNNWSNYVSEGAPKVNINGVNVNTISKYGNMLNKGVKYNLYMSSCVNHTARALTIAGVPSIGIHPFILHAQMYLRSMGLRPNLLSYYLQY